MTQKYNSNLILLTIVQNMTNIIVLHIVKFFKLTTIDWSRQLQNHHRRWKPFCDRYSNGPTMQPCNGGSYFCKEEKRVNYRSWAETNNPCNLCFWMVQGHPRQSKTILITFKVRRKTTLLETVKVDLEKWICRYVTHSAKIRFRSRSGNGRDTDGQYR